MGTYNPTMIGRLTFLGPGYSAARYLEGLLLLAHDASSILKEYGLKAPQAQEAPNPPPPSPPGP